jgi:iron complex outermembrane receptor protein
LYYFYEKASDDFTQTVFGGLYEAIGLDTSSHSVNANKTESYAAYAQATYAINNRLSATAGIRYTEESKDRTYNADSPVSGRLLIPTTQSSDNWGAWTPRIGLEFQATEDLMVYGSVSRGFKSGGFNARPQNVEGAREQYDPEFVWAYEAGFRSDWYQNRLRFNTTFFYYDYTDIQTTASKFSAVTLSNLIFTENAAKAEVKGIELEIVARPAEALLLSVGSGYVDAEYTEVSPFSTVVTEDTKFLKTPDWKFNASAQYTIPFLNLGKLILRGDYAYTGKVYNEQNNNELAAQEAFSLVNARVTFQHRSGKWDLGLGVTNLTDETYKLNGRFAPLFVPATFAPPRRWSLSLKYHF